MEKVLIDTNVLSAMLFEDELKFFVETLPASISAIAYMEMIQGTKPKRYIRDIEAYLRQYPIVYPSQNTFALAIDLLRTHSATQGLRLPDALIAASCLEGGFMNLTFNTGDFEFIKGLTLYDLSQLPGIIASRIVQEKQSKKPKR